MFYYTQCQHLGVNARVCMSLQVCVLYLEEKKAHIEENSRTSTLL